MVEEKKQFSWQSIVQYGIICGSLILYISLVGILEAFQVRDVVDQLLPLGQAMLIVIALSMGYVAARLAAGDMVKTFGGSAIVGIVGGIITALFVNRIEPWEIRNMFVNASPALVEVLTFGQESQATGLMMLITALTIVCILGAVLFIIPPLPRRMILAGLTAVLFMGMLQDFLTRIDPIEAIANILYSRKGLSPVGAMLVFILFSGLNGFWATQGDTVQNRLNTLPPPQKRGLNIGAFIAGLLLLIAIPHMTDNYITQILFMVCLYIAMGLGLNIELGWAGLLDLGFSGFFAIGAYTVAVVCSTGELGLSYMITGEIGASYSFWFALPIAVVISAIAGVVLGIPVLRTRGDYLAIITLGLAEIIRILVKSNALKELLGGAQGVLNIAKPTVGEAVLKDPMHFYYLALIACFIIGFLAIRLQHARIGRNWMALREDEDVAEAMGINLIATKLLAFGIGASFAGLSGAIFAAQLGSVFPDSFGLLVSINAVSLVIIGGVGSIPGVVIGALVLVGLPELLREFSEFRLLLYGMLLVVMMLVKPEGFWPSETARRELEGPEISDITESKAGTGA
ncbi:branched-chain amino acid ABC transporter permease [Anaerolineales bacterium HSG25]|nr:branched-chain amino acid ABC transporter permease [Anaerolineales bacterium HSG25]